MKTRKAYTNKQTPRINNQDKYNNNTNIIHEKNSDTFVKNYIKSKHKVEKYMKKNLSYSNLQNDNIEENTQKNLLNTNKNNNNNKNRCLIKHSSMKYFKITPIINPLYDRAYFTSKINLQTANNINKKNIELDKIIKNVGTTSPQQNQTLNKIQNIPIHIMNNINIINNNLVEENNLKSDNLVFIKKRIQSCHKTSLSKPKEDKNNKIKLEDYCSVFNKKNDVEINYKNKENVYENYKMKKYKQNLFNKTNIRKPKQFINNYENKNINNNFNTNFQNANIKNNINAKINNFIEKNYNTTNNNNNCDYPEYNERDQTFNMAYKELNLEDFLLIIQKFDDIKNNIKYIFSFYNSNFEQNYLSAKKILKLNHINKIKLYDLFLFYMGSSFDGSPEKLFQDKKSKYYLHIWTIIFIISLGVLFTVSQNVNLTDECSQDILKLITLQEKTFLIFCDLLLKKLSKKYKYNIWVGQILEKLKTESIYNISNHIVTMRNFIINSYEIINNLLITIKNFDNYQNSIIKENSKFLFNNFYNADWKSLNEITINQIEKNFNQYIFKSFNTSDNNYIETEAYKKSTIKNSFNRGYHTNTNINKPKNISPERSIKNSTINLSKNIPQKILLKNSNSNPSLLRKNKNINIKPQKTFFKPAIIQYEIAIPEAPCPLLHTQIPYLNFPPTRPYTLIIDLDETMVSFKFTNEKKGIGILYLRPNLENFLEVIKDYYEIIPFTSASRDYADIALDLIEKNERKKYFEKRLYREHTTQFGTKYVKELSKLGRDLSKVIIVDNLSQCFKLNTENGILISSFFGEDENDKALIELQKILIKLYYDNDDVRKGLVKYRDDIFNKISKSSEN